MDSIIDVSLPLPLHTYFMKNLLNTLADNRKAGTLADKLRKRRFTLFRSLIDTLPLPIKILDVGGTEIYWERMGFLPGKGITITLLNTYQAAVKHPGFFSLKGDGRNMPEFTDNSFDIVFSNSVIEHVGSSEDQQKMVAEMRRVGKRLYLQTPNRYFPLEPHFLFPFFQFMPLGLQTALLRRFSLGWYPRQPNKEKARQLASSIRLMTQQELRSLYPKAKIVKEKFAGLTKSFVVLEGWEG